MINFIEYTYKTIDELYESLKNAWASVKQQWEDENFEQRGR